MSGAVDPAVAVGLVKAHRERRLVPGGTLAPCIVEVKRVLERTRWYLRQATHWAHVLFQDDCQSLVRPPLPEEIDAELRLRMTLLEDMGRQRQHLAELEAALAQVTVS